MNPWKTWIRPGFWHGFGALALQATTAWLLAWAYGTDIFRPGYWWAGALIGGGFFTLREAWTCWNAGHVQNRTPFDVLTAVVPVLVAAFLMGWV